MNIFFNVCLTILILFIATWVFSRITDATKDDLRLKIAAGLLLLNIALWPVYIILEIWL